MPIDIQKVRADFPILSHTVYKRPLIYFDNAATTQKPLQVIKAISDYYENDNCNIHRGVHYLSMKATEAFEEARKEIREFINAPSTHEVVFTKGASESLNLVAASFGKKFLKPGEYIHCDYLAQEKPEEECLASLAQIAKLIRRYGPVPHVRLRPETEVAWVDWKEGGGHKEYRQPRNFGSAVLQRGAGEAILFVLNHYPTAARFVVEFPRDDFRQLVNLSTGETLPVQRRQVVVDVDRKSCDIFRLESV